MTKDQAIRIVLTGGGSGGHVYPLVAVAERLYKYAIENSFYVEIHYLGAGSEYAKDLADAGVVIHPIMSAKLRRYASLKNIFDVFSFGVSCVQAWWKLFWLMPDVVFSKGGPGALPVVWWSWFYRIPVMIHDSDSRPGLANILSSIFAKKIAISFESAGQFMFRKQNIVLTGNPVRIDFLERRTSPDIAKEELDFEKDKPLVVVLGGSQGSQPINEFIALVLIDLLKITQVLHQTGETNYGDIERLTKAEFAGAADDPATRNVFLHRYHAVPFLDTVKMKNALTAADIIIGRAGSGMIFEAAAFGKPAILIPHTASNNHQRDNAYQYAETGAATVIEEPNLLPGIFLSQVQNLLSNTAARETMITAAQAFHKPDAAQKIVENLLSLAI